MITRYRLRRRFKLKEISYIHSGSLHAAGELKHGTISLIEEGRTVIALAAYEELFDKLLSNIKEGAARRARFSLRHRGHTEVAKEAEDVIYIPKIDPLLLASLEVVPFQLYAYYVALYKGCDIDKPPQPCKIGNG